MRSCLEEVVRRWNHQDQEFLLGHGREDSVKGILGLREVEVPVTPSYLLLHVQLCW